MTACTQRFQTKYIRFLDPLPELLPAHTANSYKKVLVTYSTPVLLIIDQRLSF